MNVLPLTLHTQSHTMQAIQILLLAGAALAYALLIVATLVEFR